MKKFLSSIIPLLLAVAPLLAADAPAPASAKTKSQPTEKAAATVAETKSGAEEVAQIELKNKSSFQTEPGSRNPFWPIGWKPSAKIADSAERTGPDIPATAFVVSSITLERGAKFAIINGKIMQEGQQFGLQLGGQTYQITLKAIEDGRVIVARRDQEIIIPLRRK